MLFSLFLPFFLSISLKKGIYGLIIGVFMMMWVLSFPLYFSFFTMGWWSLCYSSLFFPFLFVSCVITLLCFYQIKKNKMFFPVFSFLFVLLYTVESLLWFFVLFETIILVSVFLVLYLGSNPERLNAGYYFLSYTAIGTAPFLFYLLSLNIGKVFSEDIIKASLLKINKFSLFFCLTMSLLLKVPLYSLHLWLPKAHVESPVSGSMLLAGMLMKLGFYGLLFLIMSTSYICGSFLFYYITIMSVGVIFSSLVVYRQFDLKSYVAYSSMVHMSMAIFYMITLSEVSYLGVLIVCLGHAFVSCLLFLLVTVYYNTTNSRNIKMNSSSKGQKMMLFFALILNTSMPLSLSFLGEVCLFKNMISLSLWGLMPPFVFFSGLLSVWLYLNMSSNQMQNNSKMWNFMDISVVVVLFFYSFFGYFLFKSLM